MLFNVCFSHRLEIYKRNPQQLLRTPPRFNKKKLTKYNRTDKIREVKNESKIKAFNTR